MKTPGFTITFTVSALLVCAALSMKGQGQSGSSSARQSDESSQRSSGTETNWSATNEFGAATNRWGTNLPPTSTNRNPRVYSGTNFWPTDQAPSREPR